MSETKNLKIKKLVGAKLLITSICLIIIAAFGIVSTTAKVFDVVGMIAAVLALAVLLFKFPLGAYAAAEFFVVLAASGSIIRMYDKIKYYDKAVHFISGIILAYLGWLIGLYLLKKFKLPQIPVLALIISFLFACAGAGAWEIAEFSADCIGNLSVQHGNNDTMGDIIAGFSGGALYGIFIVIKYKLQNKNLIK